MWIYLNNSFLSIVQNHDNADLLHVRARKKGDIEAVFPDANVKSTPTGDYKYRTDIQREVVAGVVANQIGAIDYTNFKNSVSDRQRHDAYMDTWTAAHGLEAGRARNKWDRQFPLSEGDFWDDAASLDE